MPPRKIPALQSPSRKSSRIKVRSLFTNTIADPLILQDESPPQSPPPVPPTQPPPSRPEWPPQTTRPHVPVRMRFPQPSHDSDAEIEGEVEWNTGANEEVPLINLLSKPKNRTIKTFYGRKLPKRLTKKATTTDQVPDDRSPERSNSAANTVRSQDPGVPADKTRPQSMVRSSGDSTVRVEWSQPNIVRSKSPPSQSHSLQHQEGREEPQRITKIRTRRSRRLAGQTVSEDSRASQNYQPPPPPLSVVNSTNDDENNSDDSGADEDDEDGAGLKKIRVIKKIGPDGKSIPSGRGVVIGRKLEDQLRVLKSRIKFERFADDTIDFGPWKSLFVHEIGRYVRDSLPMDVPGFSKLNNDEKKKLINHLSTYFVIEEEDEILKDWTFDNAANTFRRWKCSCHKHFIKNNTELPYEFRRRQSEWDWLCKHFSTPEFEEFSKHMINTRNSDLHINHSSGKKSYAERVQEYLAQGNKSPLLATIQHVYKKDRIGSEIANKLKEKMDEFSVEHGDEDLGDLSMDEQFKLIENAKGKKRKGTKVLESSFRRPPRPRGGISTSNRSYQQLEEELQRTIQDQLREREANERFKADMEARMKALADHVRFTPAGPLDEAGPSNYQSNEEEDSDP